MPLAFESISHGAIAFGFFNIDSDKPAGCMNCAIILN
jgi:hypothetical protein